MLADWKQNNDAVADKVSDRKRSESYLRNEMEADTTAAFQKPDDAISEEMEQGTWIRLTS